MNIKTEHSEKVSQANHFITILIPCRNEARYIDKCLDSIIENDWDKNSLEILVIDGMSEDGTRDIVRHYTEKYDFIKLFKNEKKIVSTALNLGIKNSKGDIIIRLDAHTTYSKNYFSKCVEVLKRSDAANVGGIIKTVPGAEGVIASSIAYSISHPFGVGLSHFRLAKNDEKYVDTVPFGCWYRSFFDEIGLFDEELERSQDIEFNLRTVKSGHKILLSPQIVSYYYARPNLKSFLAHNFDNGYRVTIALYQNKTPFSVRHVVPLMALTIMIALFALSFFSLPCAYIMGLGVVSYILFDLYFSIKAALRKKNLLYFFSMFFIFPTLHTSYAAGSIWGLVKSTFARFKRRPA